MSEIPADIMKTARELAQNAVNGMCMTMDHSFGLQTESEQRGLKLSMSQIAEYDVAPAIAKAIQAERERCIAELNNFVDNVQVEISGRERFTLQDINRECKTAIRYVRDRLTGDFDAHWIERPLVGAVKAEG